MDIATHLCAADFTLDWSLAGPDLASDAGLQTAVLISIFSDRRAADDDTLPDDGLPTATGNRRGWVGDTTTDQIGSRLWLLARAVASTETGLLAQQYVTEALQWLIDDGVASSVAVTTTWRTLPVRGWLDIAVVITRQGATDTSRFNVAWSATLA